jgi:hypothetical protein
VLRLEGAKDAADVAIVGNEAEVTRQLRLLAEAGSTDLLASIVPTGDAPETSMTRTRALLRSLVGRI